MKYFLKIGTATAMTALMLFISPSARAEESSIKLDGLPGLFVAQRIVANAESASREHTDIGRVVRTVFGVSFVDIEKYGIFGGPNSIFRKPFG